VPGQKIIRLVKKGGGSSFLNAGFRRFSPVTPCHRVSLRKRRRGSFEGFSRPFLSSAPAFLPGQQENRSERPTKLEMIPKFYGVHFFLPRRFWMK
jgi:hypothetical protein